VPSSPLASPDLQEARHRNHHARRIVAGFSRATPALADLWQQIEQSLSDVPVLVSEINRLHSQLRAAWLARANLAAAGRATLAAILDGESDPLSYLRDELARQGFLGEQDATLDDLMRRNVRGRR
jgi:ABC-type transporter Mla subunit MlaD